MELTRFQIKWALFISFSLVIPCFYFLFVAAGFLPLVFILLSSAQKGNDFFIIFIIHIIHCGIYGALFYGSATVTSKLIFFLKNRYARHLILLFILISLFIVAMLPIYGVAHNTMKWKNWIEIMGELMLWVRG